jgi:hypothetical protein
MRPKYGQTTPAMRPTREVQRAELGIRSARSEGLEPPTFRSVDTCQPFSVARISPWTGAIAVRLSGFVRPVLEVVRPGGSHVGSQ